MRTLAAVVAITLLAGCPRKAPIRPQAFDKGQKGAILSFQAPPKIIPWAPPGTPGPEFDAAPVLAELRPIVIEALSKNPHFSLVAEAKVFAAPAYKAHPGDPSGFISPAGYKAVTNEALYPQLAREAGADMGMGLALSLVYRGEDGAAAVVLGVGAIDTQGRGVWKGGAAAVSDRPIDVRTASPRQRLEAFKDAARKAMAELQENMAANLAVEGAQIRTGH